MSNTLDHALHNEELCDYILKSGNFSDWVVTSAYYSAIYFVCLELFPKQQIINKIGKPKSYHTFDDCYRDLYTRDMNVDKHKARLNLVEEYLPEIAVGYKTLKDACWTARYNNYKILPEVANECRDILADIKEICMPPTLAKSEATAS